MRNLTQIIRSELSGVLPVHMINIIAPKLAERIKKEYERSDCGDEEGAIATVLLE